LYEDVRELESLKSEMIRMASHDLRNPLGNAMGYFELLVNDLEPYIGEPQQEFVALIRSAQTTIKNLIEDLLTLEKVESERQSAWTTINLSTLTEEVFFAHQFQAVRKQHNLTLEKPQEPILTLGSNTQLRQAIVNLISNAIKYTPDNGVITVRLRTKQLRVEVEVTDNGYGIAKDKQERLFERFYRARDPQTEHIPGTGLGLSLVKTVAERHGGEVWVKSELGKGSTFGFWVPVITENANRAQ
jgi:signal transduction histidine kinase